MRDRIASVLRIRHVAERLALGAVARAERELAEAQRRVDAAREAYDARQHPVQPVTPNQLRLLELQGLAQLEIVQDTAADRDLTAERRAELQQAWALASVQRKSTERLADRRAEERAVTARRAADRALDEVVVLRWRR